MPESQTAANPRHQEEEKNEKKLTRTRQTNAREAHRPAPPFPKRGDHNAKRKYETRGQRERKDFKA